MESPPPPPEPADSVDPRRRTFSWSDPAGLARAGQELAGLDFLRAVQAGRLPPPPVLALLDVGLDLIEEGKVVMRLVPAEFHYNPIGSVHGGVLATLLDSVMGCAIHSRLPRGPRVHHAGDQGQLRARGARGHRRGGGGGQDDPRGAADRARRRGHPRPARGAWWRPRRPPACSSIFPASDLRRRPRSTRRDRAARSPPGHPHQPIRRRPGLYGDTARRAGASPRASTTPFSLYALSRKWVAVATTPSSELKRSLTKPATSRRFVPSTTTSRS